MDQDIKFVILNKQKEMLNAFKLVKTWVTSDQERTMWSGDNFEKTESENLFPEGLNPTLILMLHYKGEPVAYLEVHSGKTKIHDQDTVIWQIGRLISKPEYRNKGFSTQLLQYANEYLFKDKTEDMYAFCEVENNTAKKIYDKLGFVAINQAPNHRNAYLLKINKKVFEALKDIVNTSKISWKEEQLKYKDPDSDKFAYSLNVTSYVESPDTNVSDVFVDDKKIGSIWFSDPDEHNHILLRRWGLPRQYLTPALSFWLESCFENGATITTFARFNDEEKRIFLNYLGFVQINYNVALSYFTYMLNKEQFQLSKL